MTLPSLLTEPGRVEEPRAAQEFSEVFDRVVAEGKPMIVRRNGEDLAAVIPLEYLEILREVLARQEVEKRAEHIIWGGLPESLRPPQAWYDDTDDPCTPEEEPTP